MVPGMVTYFWLTPTRTGTFDALCEQLCGARTYHARPGVVDEEKDFQAWSPRNRHMRRRAPQRRRCRGSQASYSVCSACHGSQGEGNPQLNAPNSPSGGLVPGTAIAGFQNRNTPAAAR